MNRLVIKRRNQNKVKNEVNFNFCGQINTILRLGDIKFVSYYQVSN